MIWIDETSRSQNLKPEEARIWAFYAGLTRIVVHRHFDFPPDTWLLSGAGFDRRKLQAKDILDAKAEALRLVHEWALAIATATKAGRKKSNGKG